MKARTLLLPFVIITFSLVSYSQIPEKDSKLQFYKNHAGIQLNPYLNKNGYFSNFVFALRYGHNISKHVTFGAELYESIPAFGYMSQYNDLKFGLFSRYTFFPEKRIQGFIEFSPFFSHRYFKGLENLIGETPKNTPGGYIAPGVSFFTRNRKFSMDFYYNIYIHPTSFYYFHANEFSYKFNFHF
jgi:hypothetical protein